tara:strand:- start:111 stop:848 length:738 start_codon:yes stop_codon:yes gene_type:complete
LITVAISTYNRLNQLNKCLSSIDLKYVDQVLVFNDDEKKHLNKSDIKLKNVILDKVAIYQPSDFGFDDRKFRKPFYINKAFELTKNKLVLISDDDGVFKQDCIKKHYEALKKYKFCCGGIIKNNLIKTISKSILQGTNYSMHKDLFISVGQYDDFFINTSGGGDFDFWYRLYHYAKKNNIKTAYIPSAIQTVYGSSTRLKNKSNRTKSKEYTQKKHKLNFIGPMYKWCPKIRNKQEWMELVDTNE